MKTYKLTLISKKAGLDLTTKQKEILAVVNTINNGGKLRKGYKNVENIQIISINKKSIRLSCSETNKHWHISLGNKLANDYEMRDFCVGKEMFKWELI